tara:strand:+ start:40933 stop:41076 length:144 start_codon:yes stop_codon:yes gene_type:complete
MGVDFNKWVDSDNVVQIGVDEYKEQTSQWKKVFTKDELFKFFLKEFR